MPTKSVLDDLAKIKSVDKSDMLSFCTDAPKHYEVACKASRKLKLSFPKPKEIIVAGMGGSAIGGELLKDWARDKIAVPIEVCRDYSLPAYADESTLVFAVSYSGETEESLSVFLDAVKRGCAIISLSSGGKLQEFAEKLDVSHIPVPKGMAPRATLPYLFMPFPSILESIGLVSNVDLEISETIKVLKQVSVENSPAKPVNSNFSKTLASALAKYGFDLSSGGTDNHLMVIDVSHFSVSSKEIQDELDKVGIYVNRSAIPFDKKPPYFPSGIRLGTPAITTRGIKEKESKEIVRLIVKLIKNINSQKVKKQIKSEVKRITKKFPIYEDFRW